MTPKVEKGIETMAKEIYEHCAIAVAPKSNLNEAHLQCHALVAIAKAIVLAATMLASDGCMPAPPGINAEYILAHPPYRYYETVVMANTCHQAPIGNFDFDGAHIGGWEATGKTVSMGQINIVGKPFRKVQHGSDMTADCESHAELQIGASYKAMFYKGDQCTDLAGTMTKTCIYQSRGYWGD